MDQGAVHVCVLGTMCVLAEVYEEITRLSHFVSEFCFRYRECQKLKFTPKDPVMYAKAGRYHCVCVCVCVCVVSLYLDL